MLHSTMPSLRTEFIENLSQVRLNLVEKIIQNAKRLNIDIGINSPVETESKEFPLHIAVQSGNVHMVRLLLNNGAIDSANQCNQTKQTPLSLAISAINKDITDLIVNHPKFTLNKNIGVAILNAVADNDYNLTEQLLSKAKTAEEKQIIKDALNAWTKQNKTALYLAVENGDIPLVELLMKYGSDPHQVIGDINDSKNKSPWNLARSKHIDVAEAMAKSEFFTLPENFSEHIYYEAKKGKEHYAIVKALLTKAQQENQTDSFNNLTDNNDNYALHHTVLNDDTEITNLLLAHGAIENANELNKDSETPLSITVTNRSPLVQIIVNHPQFVVTDQIGVALLNAVKNNDFLQAFHLLERVKTPDEKAIVKTALNTWMSEGKFCLHIATENGNPSLMHLLLKYGADPHQKSVHEQKDKGITAWELARKHQNPAIAESMAKDSYFSLPENFTDHIYYEVKKGRIAVVRALLVKAKQENQDNGLTSLHDSKDENNSLHLAVISGNINMVKLLLEFGAIEVANEANKDKMTPLALSIKKIKTLTITHLLLNHPDFLFTAEISSAILEAANDDNFYLTECLLKKAKTLSAESLARDVLNQDAKNALYTAVENSNVRLVALLMAYGANPHAPNTNGDTPLNLAKKLALEDDAKHRTLIKNTPRRETYEAILTSSYYLEANSDKKDLDDLDFVAVVAPYQKSLIEHTPLSQEQQADLLKLAPRNRYAKELIADMRLSSTNKDDLRQTYAQLAQEDDYANVMHAKLTGNVTEHTLFKAFYLAKTHPLKRHLMKEWINELALDQSSPLQCQAKLLHALLHTNAVAWDAARCMNLEKFKETVVHLKAFIHLVAIVKTQKEMILDADTLKILEEVANGNTSVNLGIDSAIDQLPITPELKQIMHNIIYAEIINHERLSDRAQKIIFIQQALECFWKAKLPTSYSEKLLKKAHAIALDLSHDKQQIDEEITLSLQLMQIQRVLNGLMHLKQNPSQLDLGVLPPASEPHFTFHTMEPPPPYPHKQESAIPAEAQPPPAGKNVETTGNVIAEESAGQSEASEDKALDLINITDSSENTISEFPLLTAMLKYLDANGVIKEKQKLNAELDALTLLYASKYAVETKKVANEVESTNTAPPAESEIEKKPVQANPVPVPSPAQQVHLSAGLVSITAHSLFKQSTESSVTTPNASQTNVTQAEKFDVSDLYEQLKNLKPIQDALPIPETSASVENSTSQADEEDSVEENSGDYVRTRMRRRAFG